MYSWSKLNMFDSAEKGSGCYYAYYLQYVKREDDKMDNFFGELGRIVHDLQQKIMNDKLMDRDIEGELDKAIDGMKYKAPFKPQRSYFEPLKKFFVSDDIRKQFEKYTIVGIEDWYSVNINGVEMTVRPDLLAEHTERDLVLGDTKISKPYVGEDLKHKLRQLYIYSESVKDTYDMYPNYLLFLFPREPLGKREHFFEFNLNELEDSKRFVVDTVEKIEKHSDWTPRCESLDNPDSDFFAKELCSYRHICPVKCEKMKEVESIDSDLFLNWLE